jgi:hypothetical protein
MRVQLKAIDEVRRRLDFRVAGADRVPARTAVRQARRERR